MLYFIINPNSRSGEGKKVWKQLEVTLKERNIEYEAYYTKYPGHGTKLVKKCARLDNSKIIAIGGDGTVDEVINGLPLNGTVTMGFIPVGSGNDFARGMNIKDEPAKILEHILATEEGTPMDVGVVQTAKKHSHFAISSGFGYDAEVAYEVSHSPWKKILNRIHLGKLVYAVAAMKLIFTFRPSDVDLIIDDKETKHFKKTYLIAAMNLQYEGGGFRFCPDASYTDGELDFMLVHGVPKLAVLLLFPTAFFGLHRYIPAVKIFRAKKLQIKSSLPQKIHEDGEFVTITNQVTYHTKHQVIKFL